MTFVLGLTGSVGMGKSTTADMFRRRGVPVHDADAVVHALYRGEAAALIEEAFPGTVVGGAVDRDRLGQIVTGHPIEMARLEQIVHPLVQNVETEFLSRWHALGAGLLVLDIPLLFETGSQQRCHAVAVVSAPAQIQRERALARPGMTASRLDAILALQMPDAEKRRRAHAVIDSGRGVDAAQRQVDDLIRALAGRAPGRLGQAG
jgi:dephospho-CoA kinase